MKSYSTEGIIIKRRNFNEADRIVTVFTKQQGKIQIKAIGVRKIISRRSSHIELLNHSVLTLYYGRNLPILTEATTLKDFSQIKENLTKVGFAYHLCELIDGLCADNQDNQAVFNLLLLTLERLSGNEDMVSVIHEFEIELLSLLGFWSRAKPLSAGRQVDTHYIIENILERRLRSKKLFHKLS